MNINLELEATAPTWQKAPVMAVFRLNEKLSAFSMIQGNVKNYGNYEDRWRACKQISKLSIPNGRRNQQLH